MPARTRSEFLKARLRSDELRAVRPDAATAVRGLRGRAWRRRVGRRMYPPRQPFEINRASVVTFLQRWAVTTVGVLVAAHVVRGLSYDSLGGLLVASLLLGALNAFLRPLLLLLSLPLIVASVGLWVLVVNAALLYFVGAVVKSFHVGGFWSAFWGGLVISLVTLVGYAVLGVSRFKATLVRSGTSPSPRRRPPPGDGPVIDV